MKTQQNSIFRLKYEKCKYTLENFFGGFGILAQLPRSSRYVVMRFCRSFSHSTLKHSILLVFQVVMTSPVNLRDQDKVNTPLHEVFSGDKPVVT